MTAKYVRVRCFVAGNCPTSKTSRSDSHMIAVFKMCMLAAEDMNFSRAAERAFVTQQCLSDHIKKLEDSYCVKFFTRRPRLALPPECEAMLRYILRLNVLDESLQKELADLNAGIRGTIRAGFGMTRGEILIPSVAEKFREKAPNADIKITLADTRDLEPLLLAGELDVFLGVSTEQNVMFSCRKLHTENLYLLCPAMKAAGRLSGSGSITAGTISP